MTILINVSEFNVHYRELLRNYNSSIYNFELNTPYKS